MARAQEPPPNDPLTEEALGWLVRLHSGDETTEDWNAYHDWKAADSAHAQAALRAEHVWSRLGPALKSPKRARNIAGAFILVAGLGAGGFSSGMLDPRSSWYADEATGIGEIRLVALADGSSITMDSGTSFDIVFSDSTRRIILRSGQVFVQVAPDADRPFLVEAGAGEIRALGTAFNVLSDSGRTEVAVTEHSVRITYDGSISVDVSEGQALDYGLGALGALRTIDAGQAVAWQHGEIAFEDRPLGEVAAEMRRYRRGTTVFINDDLKNIPVTGLFSTRDTDAFFHALEKTLPVHVTQLPYVTLIRRDSSRSLSRYDRPD